MNQQISFPLTVGSVPRRVTVRAARAILFGVSGVLALALLSHVAYTDGPHIYAIKDARIVTVTNGTLAKGTVVIRNGLIEAVGAQVNIPSDARVIDGNGLTIYPGLIDTHTDWAQKQQSAAQGPQRGGGPPAAQRPATAPSEEERPGMNPDQLAIDQLDASASQLEKARNAGFTTALTIPRRGIFIGQSALINLAGEKAPEMVVKSPVALHVGFESAGGFRTYPGSLMGVISYIRQTFYDAQHYGQEWARYERVQRGVRRPEPDQALAALQPPLKGDLPVVFVAQEGKEVERVIKLAEEFHLKYIISGVTEGYEVAELLRQKQVPVLVSLNFPTRSRDADPEADIPLRVLQQMDKAPGTPAALHKAGVKFAFTSGFASDPKDAVKNAAKAIEAGLPEEEAVKAFTINGAEILGVREQLGSIEAGKIANLVVTDGKLFDEKTKIKHLFIDGREIKVQEPPAPPPGRGEGGRGEGRPAITAAGTWQLVVDSPQGAIDVTVTLRQSGTQISGTISSMFGQSDTTGSISGNTVQFKTTIDAQGETLEVSFEGTIEGNSMKGTVSGPMGSFSFTGTRPGQ